MSNTEKKEIKSWKDVMNKKKGGLEYNPNSSFCLYVNWICNNLQSINEMIAYGFQLCSAATQRDTPTTLAYLFTVSNYQQHAIEMKEQVKTLGDHPHYKAAYKQLEMNIPRTGVELKLRNGGIDIDVLNFDKTEEISKFPQLNFNPVALDCFELYLDNRAFYDHAASREWMKAYSEIVKPVRSLKPTTYCLGKVSQKIWDGILEPSFKAQKFSEEKKYDIIMPDLSINKTNRTGTELLYFEFDLFVDSVEKLINIRSLLNNIQNELQTPYSIVVPISFDTLFHIRLIFTFICSNDDLSSPSLNNLCNYYYEMKARIIVFDIRHGMITNTELLDPELISKRKAVVKHFIESHSILTNNTNIIVADGHEMIKEHKLAGYPLHPQYLSLIQDNNFNFERFN